tara:strand:- start:1818 stop:2252 length:435 start_codon:yes stop_codon:yes gene_type:complete
MILISHRGNTEGEDPEKENNPLYINNAIKKGFEVEIDVWYNSDIKQWFLGHDTPQYKVDVEYLMNPKLWCHAKNINALYEMLKRDIHCFWHQNDNYTITSNGFIWTYPENKLTKKSICLHFKRKNVDYKNICYGVCSDWIETFR